MPLHEQSSERRIKTIQFIQIGSLVLLTAADGLLMAAHRSNGVAVGLYWLTGTLLCPMVLVSLRRLGHVVRQRDTEDRIVRQTRAYLAREARPIPQAGFLELPGRPMPQAPAGDLVLFDAIPPGRRAAHRFPALCAPVTLPFSELLPKKKAWRRSAPGDRKRIT